MRRASVASLPADTPPPSPLARAAATLPGFAATAAGAEGAAIVAGGAVGGTDAAVAEASDPEALVAASVAAPSAPEFAAAAPVYRTLVPPSTTLHFVVQRGEAAGAAALVWRLDPEGGYALELQSTAGPTAGASASAAARRQAAALAPSWKSQGTLDAAGIAPERFAVVRRGRERHAANFQRQAGLVSFSGPSRTWPLVAGAQDRLSWIVQLAAVLQAEPSLLTRAAPISMMVVGAHGDAALWTFSVLGPGTLEGPDGEPMPIWRLQRLAQHAHDAQVEVWVAPALHHWPLKLRLTRPARGESTEWRLHALRTSP